MGGAAKDATRDAATIKKVEEQVGIMRIQLQSHGGDIEEMKLRMDVMQ